MALNQAADYRWGFLGSLGLHASIVVGALFFAAENKALNPIPERAIIRAELVSLADLQEPEAVSAQRIIDLTQASPPPPAAPEAERIHMPVETPEPAEPKPVVDQPPQDTGPSAEELRLQAEQVARSQREEQQRQLEQQRQSELSSALASEFAALEVAQNQQQVMTHAAWVAQRVENNWSRPPSARTGMVAKLRVNLVPTGRVVSVDVIESSGDEAFDRSAVQAVRKAEPYDKLTELSPQLFDQEFRQFVFVFNPRDLRL